MTDTHSDSAAAHQRRVDAHFDARARDWKDLYEEISLHAMIHQERRSIALGWIEELGLHQASRILEVGCGAGLLAVDLAKHGHIVDCIDSSEAMVDLARAQAAETGVNDGLRVSKGDTHALQFEANSFDLVIALGVVPFLHSPAAALAEMARVVKPTGYVLITSDNRFRLNHVIDPRFTPVLAPVKETVRQVARRLGWREWAVTTHRFSYASLDRLLSAAGLAITRRMTLGFGPFSLFGWQPLPDALSIRLHRRLQDLADRGTPVLRATGAQHIVLASTRAGR